MTFSNASRSCMGAIAFVTAVAMGGSLQAVLDSGNGDIALAQSVMGSSNGQYQSGFRPAPKPVAQNHRTFLVNGLASFMPFVGYGFKNLQKKLTNAKTYAYATPVEGRAVIEPRVLRDIRAAHRRDPSVKINLVGISYGANIVTSLAAKLNRDKIAVNYLGVIDGPMPRAITPNVHRVDNFVCRMPGCIGAKVRLARGNKTTIKTEFKFRSTHIAMADNDKVHARILNQFTSYALDIPDDTRLLAHSPERPSLAAQMDGVITGSISQ